MVKSWWVGCAAGALWAIVLAVPATAQTPTEKESDAAGSCVLLSMALDADDGDVLLHLETAGNPTSLGARIEQGGGVVLDLAGCVAGPDLSGHTYPDGLVSSLQLVQRAASDGPVTAVAVETRRPFKYAVTSDRGSVQLRLRPEADPGQVRRPLVRVLEPLAPPRPAPLRPEEPPAQAPGTQTERPAVAEVEELVERWARAWSDQRIEDYLASYASTFRPSLGTSRVAWEAQRRKRLTAVRSIEVSLEGLQVQVIDAGLASASFWQSYSSDLFQDRVYKTQTWIEEAGGWKILDEAVVTPPTSTDERSVTAASTDTGRLLEGARLSVTKAPRYDPVYRIVAYPGGDPGWQRGSGMEVVVRAYRHAEIDLQVLIHEDILAAMAAYGIQEPDPNIDHRRVRNLAVFLRRRGQELAVDPAADWRPGDLVLWAVEGRRPNHVGILSDRLGPSGHPLVIHHLADRRPAEEDVLFSWPVKAHFRWPPAASD